MKIRSDAAHGGGNVVSCIDAKRLDDRCSGERPETADISCVFMAVELDHIDDPLLCELFDLFRRFIDKNADGADSEIQFFFQRSCLLQRYVPFAFFANTNPM